MARKRNPPGVDARLLIKDAAKLIPVSSRRQFLRGAGSLGALTFLTGCDIIDGPSAESALRYVSNYNDWVQARLFQPQKLAADQFDDTLQPGANLFHELIGICFGGPLPDQTPIEFVVRQLVIPFLVKKGFDVFRQFLCIRRGQYHVVEHLLEQGPQAVRFSMPVSHAM